MTSNSSLLPEKTYGSRYWATFVTLIYVILFFPLFPVVLCSTLIAYETFSPYHAILKIILYCIFLLSLPASIFYMWSTYRKHHYRQTYITSMLPVFTFFIVYLADWSFDFLLNPWH
jgi:hypothetical protein